MGRSREGAWIEIPAPLIASVSVNRRSREGAWIEIRQWAVRCMHEASRSREGAWIEMSTLKAAKRLSMSLPRGSVD